MTLSRVFHNVYNIQMVLLFSLIFLALLYYFIFLWRKRHMFIKSWNFPGPFNFPVIGSAYKLMARPENIIRNIQKLQAEYPEGFKFWFGQTKLLYLLHKPEQIQKVLGGTKFLKKDSLYIHVSNEIGDGILTSLPEKWKKHRKLMMPCFNQKVLDSFVDVFVEKSLTLSEILLENCEKGIDIYKIILGCFLEEFVETAMGVQLEVQGKDTIYQNAFDKMMKMTFIHIFQIWNHIDFIWKFLGYEKIINKYRQTVNGLTDSVIQQKMKVLEEKKHRKPSLVSIDEEIQRLPLLDYLMENGQFNARELRDEITVFLFAGTETSAITLDFLFACLGMFPDIQQKVYEEVILIMGEDRQPNAKDLPLMVYTERVIKEVLRLFPSVAYFLREITEDLDMGDFTIPEGASVYFGLTFIHRNPKYWPDPLKFDPDRFLPEEVAKRHPCTYLPFSIGPRNCIGMKYAMNNMKATIAVLIRKLRFHCEYKKIEDIEVKANLMLRFRDGAKLTVTARK